MKPFRLQKTGEGEGRVQMAFGFVLAYLVTSFIAMLSIISTDAMTGNEPGIVLFMGYTVGWCVLYGLGGGIPAMIARDAKDSAGVGFVRFGAGGAAAGGLIAILIITGNLGGSRTAAYTALAFPFIVPWVLGVLSSFVPMRGFPN